MCNKPSIDDCKVMPLPKVADARGNLSFLQNGAQLPFPIRRTYWIYDVPGGAGRGGHAERENEEAIVALSGSFDVTVDDGTRQRTFPLNRSYHALYIPAGIWRHISNFSTNALALEMGSTPYDEADYIRDYAAFLAHQPAPRATPALTGGTAAAQHPKMCNVFDCTMVELDQHHSDRKGNLSVVENGKTLPFDVRRVYYLYDVPGGAARGGHAHRALSQLIVAASGSFSVSLDDGARKRTFFLNRPYQGLYVGPGVWRTLHDFSSGAVCMVLASEPYDEADYLRHYDAFLQFRNQA